MLFCTLPKTYDIKITIISNYCIFLLIIIVIILCSSTIVVNGKQKNDKKNFQRGVKGLGTALKISKFNEISSNCHGIGFNNQGSSVMTDKRKFAASDKKNNEFDDKMRHLRERNLKQSKQKKIVKIQDPHLYIPAKMYKRKKK